MKSGGADEHCPGQPLLQQVIGDVIASHAGRHPGIIAEAIVERIAATFVLTPREHHHRNQRKNHLERTRRFSHEVYRVLADTPDLEPVREIAARLNRSFLLTRRPQDATPEAIGP
jgi:hypothetical protein